MSARTRQFATALAIATLSLIAPCERALASTHAPADLLVRFTTSTNPGAAYRILRPAGVTREQSLGFSNVYEAWLAGNVSADDALHTLRGTVGIAYAERNHTVVARDDTPSPVVPDDARFGEQWWLSNTGQSHAPQFANRLANAGDDIHAEQAWAVTTGSAAVRIGLIDTGIDTSHPALAPNIDLHGAYDFVDDDTSPVDTIPTHGTHVAGIIAATGSTTDPHTISGVDWSASIVPFRVLDSDSEGTDATIAEGFDRAGRERLPIVNASLGSNEYSSTQALVIARHPGTLYVTAADEGTWSGNGTGRSSDELPDYPCDLRLPNLICVGASDTADRVAPFSDWGTTSIDLFAPGVGILSTLPNAHHNYTNAYGYESGTSMSTAMVSGVLGLVKAVYPRATTQFLKAAVLDGVDVRPALRYRSRTGGRLDAAGALAAAATLAGSGHPLTPTAISPLSEAHLARPRPVFVWSPSGSAFGLRGYRLLVDGKQYGHIVTPLTTSNDGNLHIHGPRLGVGYHDWSVVAIDGEGHSQSSAPVSFVVTAHPRVVLALSPPHRCGASASQPCATGRAATVDVLVTAARFANGAPLLLHVLQLGSGHVREQHSLDQSIGLATAGDASEDDLFELPLDLPTGRFAIYATLPATDVTTSAASARLYIQVR